MGRDPETRKNRKSDLELMRLTIPRRTYTLQHLDYVAECMKRVFDRRLDIRGLEFTYEAPVLRHFTSRFRIKV
jgi:tryptophanase